MRISQRLMDVGWWTRIVLGICLACMSGCTSSDEIWARVRETGVLRVGMDASFPPFEAVEPGGVLIGFDVALARALGRLMGVRIEFVSNLPYDGLYDALAIDRVDVVISALVVNPDRMADVAYSDVYFEAGQVLVVPRALLGIEQMSDLAGRVVAVEFGTRGDLEVRKWARRSDGLTNLHCGTAGEAVTAVLSGTADAAVVDYVTALVWTNENPDLVITNVVLASEPYAIAAKIGSNDLMRVINQSLETLAQDGTLDELTRTWLLSP
ncbi:MAG: transporter substrate-binding domain-containing protein [Anaerolineae bacterium]|nr:transporter substrate-binding domain-containing protein [Anaerolineae bacterium]